VTHKLALPVADEKGLREFQVTMKQALFVSNVTDDIGQSNYYNSEGFGPHAI